MANSYHHAVSSARRFGGVPEDYQAVHDFFDSSKAAWADNRHRAVLHHSFGIFIAERIFGPAITRSDGVKVPTRLIAEQHVREDHGFIPTLEDWFKNTPNEPWMCRGARKLSRELEDAERFQQTIARETEIGAAPQGESDAERVEAGGTAPGGGGS